MSRYWSFSATKFVFFSALFAFLNYSAVSAFSQETLQPTSQTLVEENDAQTVSTTQNVDLLVDQLQRDIETSPSSSLPEQKGGVIKPKLPSPKDEETASQPGKADQDKPKQSGNVKGQEDTTEAKSSNVAAATQGAAAAVPEAKDAANQLFSGARYKAINGSFTYNYQIDVPGFRGLEPGLVLSYSSRRKRRTGGQYQGWLGHGWGLDGFDVIERRSKGNGAPYYNEHDVYYLNGDTLHVCTGSSVSPSCATGGTHFTRNESYLRIQKISVDWVITRN